MTPQENRPAQNQAGPMVELVVNSGPFKGQIIHLPSEFVARACAPDLFKLRDALLELNQALDQLNQTLKPQVSNPPLTDTPPAVLPCPRSASRRNGRNDHPRFPGQ